MPRIHQSSNLTIALALSVAINAALIVGLSQLMVKPSIQGQPPAQRLSLASAPGQVDAVPVDASAPTTDTAQDSKPEATQPESEPGAVSEPRRQPSSAESQAPETDSEAPARNDVATLPKPNAPVPVTEPADPRKVPPSADLTEPPAVDVESEPGNTKSESAETTQPIHNTAARATNDTERDSAPGIEVPNRSDRVAAMIPQSTTQRSNTGPQSAPPEDTSALPLAHVEFRPELDYPAMAKRRRQQGQVTLRAWLNDDGELEQLSIAESSGHALLDESALEQIGHWSFMPPDTNSNQRWIRIPVEFRLR